MKKILLVSKDPRFLTRNDVLLQKAGFSVHAASSAREALEIHQSNRTNVIISDLDLPDGRGEELISQLREHEELRQVSTLLVCYPHRQALERAASSGANEWAVKPLQPAELLGQVSRLANVAARRPCNIPVTVTGDLPWARGKGVLLNISRSGALCETVALLACGARIDLELQAVGASMACEVVRSELQTDGVSRYGIRFFCPDASQLDVIERHVAGGDLYAPAA